MDMVLTPGSSQRFSFSKPKGSCPQIASRYILLNPSNVKGSLVKVIAGLIQEKTTHSKKLYVELDPIELLNMLSMLSLFRGKVELCRNQGIAQGETACGLCGSWFPSNNFQLSNF